MALDTYAGLKASIADFLNRSDLTAVIPDFITLAEAQMLRRLLRAKNEGKQPPRDMLNSNGSFALTAGTELYVVTGGSGLLGIHTFTIEPQTIVGQTYGAVQLGYLSPENFDNLKQRRGSAPAAAIPRYFTIRGNSGSGATAAVNIEVLPIPDLNYTAKIFYWQNPFPLATTNWVLTKHPDVYLYGALMQAAPYLKDDARAETWGTLFTAALGDLINSDPLPADLATMRVDDGLTFARRHYSFDINTGDYR